VSPSTNVISDSKNARSRLNAAGIVSLIVFGLFTFLIQILPDRIFYEGDDVVIRNMKISDADYLTSGSPSPRMLIAGSSRLIPQDHVAVAKEALLSPDQVLNVSSPGATFFYVDTFLKRHPEVTKDLQLLVIDVMPSQIMFGNHFKESAAFFLRNASAAQRIRVREFDNRVKAIMDLCLPTWSRSQTPHGWAKGIRRIDMDAGEVKEDILSRSRFEMPRWRKMMAMMDRVRKKEGAAQNRTRIMLYPKPDISRNQMDALHNIINRVPDDCRIALVWLPLVAESQSKINIGPNTSASQKALTTFLESIVDSKLHVYRYLHSNELGLGESHYTLDGVHFTPDGSALVSEKLGEIFRTL